MCEVSYLPSVKHVLDQLSNPYVHSFTGDVYFKIEEAIHMEQQRESTCVNLIASENLCSVAVRSVVGSVLTNKYAEGYPGHRYYAGCQAADLVEDIAQRMWLSAFNLSEYGWHVNVQPHSGTNANIAALLAFRKILKKDRLTVLSMQLSHGGHLSHGAKVSHSSDIADFVFYGVDNDGWLDYDALMQQACEVHPDVLLCGASAYPREIEFTRMREIANACGAKLMVDMAHIAGLVAAGCHESPFGEVTDNESGADIVTTTTHKTLRGPRGGMIFCKQEYTHAVDSAVFPGTQGGPLVHVIAGKAQAGFEAFSQEFKAYQQQVVHNMDAMVRVFNSRGFKLSTSGSDNHLVLMYTDRGVMSDNPLTGAQAESMLSHANIIVNKNMMPGDKRPPSQTSGIRIGTPFMTTVGWTEQQFTDAANAICDVLVAHGAFQ